MKRYLTEEEIKKAKADKNIREEIVAEIEAKLEIGKPRPVTVDGPDPETGYKMGAYRMTRRVATVDAIQQFCDAIGDFNPLYRNRDYVKNSRYGGIIAPPQFLGPSPLIPGSPKRRRAWIFMSPGWTPGFWWNGSRSSGRMTGFRYLNIPLQ